MGEPFLSRRTNGQGLSFPSVKHWGTFVCEHCTVRAVLGRELCTLRDLSLMALERMRILDLVHHWTKGTYVSYQGKLSLVRRFEQEFGVSILPSAQLRHPSTDPIIPLMWCQEAYSLQPGSSRSSKPGVSFGSIRQIRSAVSQHMTWEYAVNPQSSVLEDQGRRVLHLPCRPTDQLSSQLHAVGMAARIGTLPRPATTLLHRHVHSFDTHYDHLFRHATSWNERRELTLAALANLTLWLGWLRSREALDLKWSDLTIIPPDKGASKDLPTGIGAISLRLAPETKSCRVSEGDVVVAYTTASGLSLGMWLGRARELFDLDDSSLPPTSIFCHLDGQPWSSQYFRTRHLYPHLQRLRQQGDPYLRNIPNIPSAFWSLHCYRRGARSHVSSATSTTRRATLPQVYEHARWRLKRRQSEAIDKVYQEWTLYGRLQLTLLCM